MSNVKNLANMPFGGTNIARTVGQVAANYNAAYANLIIAGVDNAVAAIALIPCTGGASLLLV